MSPLATLAPSILARARVDQVAQIYAGWHRTSTSMLLGAMLLCFVFREQVSPWLMLGWVLLIVANQIWRGALVRAWTRAQPGVDAAPRWGRYWTIGATIAGSLWGLAALVTYPPSAPHQGLLIVCLFGVVLGSLRLTAVYRPTFYGFVLPALAPLIVRVALEGDQVHLYTALVMTVVLAFILAYGHSVNNLLTRSLAMRYENLDLIAELKGQSRAAHEARSAAESANRAKSQLLAAASHDLRQPLHALGLYTAALAARATEAQWLPLVGNVQRSAAALESQFEQLLDLSRLEAGGLTAENARVNLHPLLTRIGSEMTAQAEGKQIALRVLPTRLWVVSDPALLERVVRNLVVNAIRYTQRGGVLVGARRRNGQIAIDVVDTGVGIAAEDREHIFEEFYQVRDGRSSRAHAGMGLGLAIVRRLAALLGHRIEVASRIGRGSRFRVLLPPAPEATARLAVRACRVASPSRAGATALAGALVAVIDDDSDAVDAMSALFGTWGATVAGGGDTATLLETLGTLERYPDLIVADLRLAGSETGIMAVGKLRNEFGFAVPAMLVSGDTAACAASEARAAGLVLLPKPVVPTVLQAVATALIARGIADAA
jgi:signal transduction histidine kinase